MEFSGQEHWSGLPFPSPRWSFQPRDWTWVSCIAGGFFTIWVTREKPTCIKITPTHRLHSILQRYLEQGVGRGSRYSAEQRAWGVSTVCSGTQGKGLGCLSYCHETQIPTLALYFPSYVIPKKTLTLSEPRLRESKNSSADNHSVTETDKARRRPTGNELSQGCTRAPQWLTAPPACFLFPAS